MPRNNCPSYSKSSSQLVVRQQFNELAKSVAYFFGMHPDTVFNRSRRSGYGGSRKREIVQVRHITLWLAMKVLRTNLSQLARILNWNHSSIIYAIRSVDAMRAYSESLCKRIDELQATWQEERTPPPVVPPDEPVERKVKSSADDDGVTDVAWGDTQGNGQRMTTPRRYFIEQNDRFCKAMREALRAEALEKQTTK